MRRLRAVTQAGLAFSLALTLIAPDATLAQAVAVQDSPDRQAPGSVLQQLVGSRIRYETWAAPGLVRVGRVLAVQADTLLVTFATPRLTAELYLPATTLRDLKVSHGRGSKGVTGAIIGSVVGGVALGALAAAATEPDEDLAFGLFLAIPFGAGLGGSLGALMGSAVPVDKWGSPPVGWQVLPDAHVH